MHLKVTHMFSYNLLELTTPTYLQFNTNHMWLVLKFLYLPIQLHVYEEVSLVYFRDECVDVYYAYV